MCRVHSVEFRALFQVYLDFLRLRAVLPTLNNIKHPPNKQMHMSYTVNASCGRGPMLNSRYQ